MMAYYYCMILNMQPTDFIVSLKNEIVVIKHIDIIFLIYDVNFPFSRQKCPFGIHLDARVSLEHARGRILIGRSDIEW